MGETEKLIVGAVLIGLLILGFHTYCLVKGYTEPIYYLKPIYYAMGFFIFLMTPLPAVMFNDARIYLSILVFPTLVGLITQHIPIYIFSWFFGLFLGYAQEFHYLSQRSRESGFCYGKFLRFHQWKYLTEDHLNRECKRCGRKERGFARCVDYGSLEGEQCYMVWNGENKE